MKEALQTFYTNPKYAKAFEWGKLITITGGAQIIIQAIGLIGGVLIVRLLSTNEYAYYTITNTMLGTMMVLADGGIAIGVMAAGGKVWGDYQKLGTVITTGLNLRITFAIISYLVATPILFYLLHHHGASILLSTLIILSILPAFLTNIQSTILQIPLKLHQSIGPLQRNQLENSVIRLLLLFLTLFFFPWASIALLAAGIPQIWVNKRLKVLTLLYANLEITPSKLVRDEIMLSVRRIFPDAAYYCLSSQLTIWLISVFGQTASIAQIGALGRFNAALSVLNLLYSTLVVPRFARLSNDHNLIGFFIKAQLILGFVCLGVIGFSWFFSDQLLLLLGVNYGHLQVELTLCMVGGCINVLAGVTFGLYSSRGFAIRPILLIPLNFAITMIGVFFVDYSTLFGILQFNIFVATVQLMIHLIYGFFKIRPLSADNNKSNYLPMSRK